jgi:rod shape-determining protein MreC
MSLGTLDRSPPPFFRQGPSALTMLAFCSALALFLMVADTRLQITQPLRAGVATVLHPLQRALLAPVGALREAGAYFAGLSAAVDGRDAAHRELAVQAEQIRRAAQLAAENARLRSLLDLRPALAVRAQAAQVLYDAPDPYSRKVIVDIGAAQGVRLASPVINEAGVLGQVTRVYPLSSEVTLLTDKDAAIPVLNARSQVRGAAFGTAGGMELRFMAGNADVQIGDALSTSGVDGIYPAGVPVGQVVSVDRKTDGGFARIGVKLAAPVDGVRHVLVLEPLSAQLPPPPEPLQDEARPASPRKGAKK